jgi:hypothetical protein
MKATNIEPHYPGSSYTATSRPASLRTALPLLCPSLGVSLDVGDTARRPQAPAPAWQWVNFLRAAHGEEFLLALCNLLSVEAGLSPLATAEAEVGEGGNRSVTLNSTGAEVGGEAGPALVANITASEDKAGIIERENRTEAIPAAPSAADASPPPAEAEQVEKAEKVVEVPVLAEQEKTLPPAPAVIIATGNNNGSPPPPLDR